MDARQRPGKGLSAGSAGRRLRSFHDRARTGVRQLPLQPYPSRPGPARQYFDGAATHLQAGAESATDTRPGPARWPAGCAGYRRRHRRRPGRPPDPGRLTAATVGRLDAGALPPMPQGRPVAVAQSYQGQAYPAQSYASAPVPPSRPQGMVPPASIGAPMSLLPPAPIGMRPLATPMPRPRGTIRPDGVFDPGDDTTSSIPRRR